MKGHLFLPGGLQLKCTIIDANVGDSKFPDERARANTCSAAHAGKNFAARIRNEIFQLGCCLTRRKIVTN
jgi:hypothetical protein